MRGALARFAEVGAFACDLFADPTAGHRPGDGEGDGRADRRPGDGDGDRLDLNPKLAAERIVGAAGAAERRPHSDGGQHRSAQAADAVDADHVARTVDASPRLDRPPDPTPRAAGAP